MYSQLVTDYLTLPEKKFFIVEHEPLVWMVSLLFTDKFQQREDLTISSGAMLRFERHKLDKKPEYKDLDELYSATEKWIEKNDDAAKCLSKAKEAINAGELCYYAPPADEWGDRPYYTPERDVSSYDFFVWAERGGYQISKDVLDSLYTIIHMTHSRKAAEHQQAYTYPQLTKQDFERLSKEPLWEATIGLLYLVGRRCRIKGKEGLYTGDNGLLKKLGDYFVEAVNAGQLNVIYDSVPDKPKVTKIAPNDLIAWAQKMPLTLPMLTLETESETKTRKRPAYCTEDMALMYDAVEKFWGEYDLSNPNPNAAPMKKEVVEWLLNEAEKRSIADFSKTRAEIMDTIIRCPKARKGGNSL